MLEGLGLRPAGERPPRVLVVLDRTEDAVWKSFRNLGVRVQILLPEELNAYDVLLNDYVVFSRATLDSAVERYSERAPGQANDASSRASDHEVETMQNSDDSRERARP